MKRRTFDKLVSFVGLGLAVLLFIFAGLLNFGGGFASENVRTQLANQNIAFPVEAGLPANTKDQLLKWAGQQVVSGEMARDGHGRRAGRRAGPGPGPVNRDLHRDH